MAVGRMRQQQAEAQRVAAEAQRQVGELQVALARQERERQPPPTPGVDGARLQELLRLQAELESVRAGAWQREHELQQRVGALVGGQRSVGRTRCD